MVRLTSRPIRSISSNGPIRKPPPRRTTRSIVAASATPSPSIRSDSSAKGRASRLATKPGVSLARIGVRPIASATSVVAASARSEESLGGDHLDQLHQRRRVEEVHADHALGVRARRRRSRRPAARRCCWRGSSPGRSGGQLRRTARCFSSSSSGAASISSSQPASSPIASAGPIRFAAASASASLQRPRAAPLASASRSRRRAALGGLREGVVEARLVAAQRRDLGDARGPSCRRRGCRRGRPSPALEVRLALLEEGLHALDPVLGRHRLVEQRALGARGRR